jgi:hypothetical protein
MTKFDPNQKTGKMGSSMGAPMQFPPLRFREESLHMAEERANAALPPFCPLT